MILCNHCGAANQEGSAYCLECGTELARKGPAEPSPAPVDESLAGAPSPSIVCPSCNTTNTIQDGYCKGCGARLDYSPAPASSTEIPIAGAPAAREEENKDTAFFGAAQNVSRARLVLIRGEGFDGASYDLNLDRMLAGRSEGLILFPDDQYLSPKHAEFLFRETALFVRDVGSLNGVYRRVKGRIQLSEGDQLVVGEQVFRFHRSESPPALPGFVDPNDETMHLGSAAMDVGPFCLEQILRGGQLGNVLFPPMGEMSVGREGCDLNFPEDGHLSRLHARVFLEGDAVVLQDMDSKNGTFIRLRGESELKNGDLLFLGQQVMRVEMVSH